MRKLIDSLIPAGLVVLAAAPALAHTATLGVEYDSAGRVEQLIHPDLTAETYTYNALDSPETVRYGLLDVVTSTVFTPSGHIEQRQISDAVVEQGALETRAYDVLGRLTSQRIDAGWAVYHATDIDYDERGHVERIHRDDDLLANTSIRYGYSAQGQLKSYRLEGSSTAEAGYDYDDQGNLLSRSGLGYGSLALAPYAAAGTFDTRNRLIAPGWEYDDAGRLTADDDHLYAYNRAGRLALVSDRSGNMVAHYLYDAAGLRVRKLTETTVTYYYRDQGGSIVGERTYDLQNPEQVLATRDYVSHNGDTVMTASSGDEEGLEVQLPDRMGNPVVRLEGDEVTLQEYSPFGHQMRQDPHGRHDGAYDYTGHERDAETGHIYMKARYYSPHTARFARPDPARDFDAARPASHNLYQYTYNNPVNLVDPTGEMTDQVRVRGGVGLPGWVKRIPGVGKFLGDLVSIKVGLQGTIDQEQRGPGLGYRSRQLAAVGEISLGWGKSKETSVLASGAGVSTDLSADEKPVSLDVDLGIGDVKYSNNPEGKLPDVPIETSFVGTKGGSAGLQLSVLKIDLVNFKVEINSKDYWKLGFHASGELGFVSRFFTLPGGSTQNFAVQHSVESAMWDEKRKDDKE